MSIYTPTLGCKEGEKRATYIVKEKQDERLNDIAWWDRKDKKEIVQEALDLYLERKKDVPQKPLK